MKSPTAAQFRRRNRLCHPLSYLRNDGNLSLPYFWFVSFFLNMLFFSRDCHLRLLARVTACGMLAATLTHCTSVKKADVVVSVKDQKLGLYEQGELRKTYKISTSKFGTGDKPGSNRTPLGQHEVVAKIGSGLPTGAVLKSRRWSGEVIKPNAPGRDPIVSRILWLKGTESSNRNAFGRFIYIHGTPEENRLGQPASYGCVRMGMKDVVNVFDSVPVGAKVYITTSGLPKGKAEAEAEVAAAQAQPTTPTTEIEKAVPIEIAKLQTDPREKANAEANLSAGPEKPTTVKKATPAKRTSSKSSSTAAKKKSSSGTRSSVTKKSTPTKRRAVG